MGDGGRILAATRQLKRNYFLCQLYFGLRFTSRPSARNLSSTYPCRIRNVPNYEMAESDGVNHRDSVNLQNFQSCSFSHSRTALRKCVSYSYHNNIIIRRSQLTFKKKTLYIFVIKRVYKVFPKVVTHTGFEPVLPP
jgi:hypothetical protein